MTRLILRERNSPPEPLEGVEVPSVTHVPYFWSKVCKTDKGKIINHIKTFFFFLSNSGHPVEEWLVLSPYIKKITVWIYVCFNKYFFFVPQFKNMRIVD